MAGQLDSLFKNVAKSVVKDLGTSLDTSITYVRKASATYNVATGAVTSTDTSYSFKAPVEFIASRSVCCGTGWHGLLPNDRIEKKFAFHSESHFAAVAHRCQKYGCWAFFFRREVQCG